MVNITGLWKGKEGSKVALSGKVGNVVFLIFKNDHKTEDKHPDYNLCVANPEPSKEQEPL